MRANLKDVQSDVDVPNALNSSDQEDENSENGDGIEDDWTSQLREIRVQNFTEETRPTFPDGYDCNTATPMDYFNLMYSMNIIPDFVRHTSSYTRWKMEQSETDDPIWYEVAENEMKAYLSMNIFMGINKLPGYKDYWSKNNFIGNEGIKSVMTVRRYEKLTE